MSKPRITLPTKPEPAQAPPEAARVYREALGVAQAATIVPTCSNCPFWHKSTKAESNETCRHDPPQYNPNAYLCRTWPHTLGTDYCWRHPVLQRRFQALLAAPNGTKPHPELENPV